MAFCPVVLVLMPLAEAQSGHSGAQVPRGAKHALHSADNAWEADLAQTDSAEPHACLQMLQKQGGPLETNLVKAVAVSIARGMTHLHKRRPPLLHLDLKVRSDAGCICA